MHLTVPIPKGTPCLEIKDLYAGECTIQMSTHHLCRPADTERSCIVLLNARNAEAAWRQHFVCRVRLHADGARALIRLSTWHARCVRHKSLCPHPEIIVAACPDGRAYW